MAQEKWEYITEFIRADIANEGARDYLQKRWPNFKPDKYTPETMISTLNSRGVAGWELVSMQPVFVGNNSDIGLVTGTGLTYWTHCYFCAWKRRINE